MAAVVGNTLRVAARHKWNDIDDIVNVFHFELLALPTPNNEAALLEDVSEHISTAYADIASSICNNATAYDISVYNYTQDAPVGATNFSGGYAGGTASAECLPAAACALVLLNTPVKRTQGRIYLSPFGESGQVDGIWQGGLLAAIGGFVDQLRDITVYSNGSQFAYGVLKRSSGILFPVTSVRIQPIIAYQRRRKPGRGS